MADEGERAWRRASLGGAHTDSTPQFIPLPPALPPPATGSLLIILLETHAAAWAALAAPSPTGGAGITPPVFIAQVGAFVGSYELEAEGNEAVVLAVHTGCW